MSELEITVFAAAAIGVGVGHVLSAISKRITRFVRKTDNKVDDFLWETVQDAVKDVLRTDKGLQVFSDVGEDVKTWPDASVPETLNDKDS